MSARRTTTLALALALALAAGCGDDDDDDAAPTTRTEGGSAAFCDAVAKLDDTFARSNPDLAGLPEPSDADRERSAGRIESRLGELEAAAPADLEAQVGTITDAIRSYGESHSTTAFRGGFGAAKRAVDDAVADRCELPTVEVVALEHGYTGLDGSLPAGPTRFELTNDGSSPHELSVFSVDAGAEGALDALATTVEPGPGLTFAGSVFVGPGSSEVTYVDLTPGRYVAVCLIREGATAFAPGPDDAPTHLALGMRTSFEVDEDDTAG